ncbi:hypothetical protein JCM10213v2_000691 [Rhodosporidiobolus nylandii]
MAPVPPVLNPYPSFELAALPSLSSLNTDPAALFPWQLALIQFHPEATDAQRAKASALFARRRMEGLARGEEVNAGTKMAELRQLKRAQQWLAGTLPPSRPMRDAEVQSGSGTGAASRLFTLDEVKERVRNVSRAAVDRALEDERAKHAQEREEASVRADLERRKAVATALAEERTKQMAVQKIALDSALEAERKGRMKEMEAVARHEVESEKAAVRQPAQTATPEHSSPSRHLPPRPEPATSQHLPSPPVDDSAPPGPFFDFESTAAVDQMAAPRELILQLHVASCISPPSEVTPQLFLAYMLRRQSSAFPRPLAISKSKAGHIMIAFRSQDHVSRAVAALQHHTIPRTSGSYKIEMAVRGTGSHAFKRKQLSKETQQAWDAHGRLPDAEWIPQASVPPDGVTVSEAYEAEWARIHRATEHSRGSSDRGLPQHELRDSGLEREQPEQSYAFSSERPQTAWSFVSPTAFATPPVQSSFPRAHPVQSAQAPASSFPFTAPPPTSSYANPRSNLISLSTSSEGPVSTNYPQPAAQPRLPPISAAHPGRRVPPPPPPAPPVSYSYAQRGAYEGSAAPLPFSLPAASAPSSTYSNPLVHGRSWEPPQSYYGQVQEGGPTLDPRKRPRLG